MSKRTNNRSRVGDDGGGDGGGGRIFPGHPGPIPNAPRDNISRKAIPSLRYGKSNLDIWENMDPYGSIWAKCPPGGPQNSYMIM